MKQGSLLLASLLIAGMAIGLTFLGIPLISDTTGYIPAALICVLVWIFAFCIGLLFAEVSLAQPDGANVSSFTNRLLGKNWMIVISIVYLINIYAYLTSYYLSGPYLITWFLQDFLGITFPPFLAGVSITIFFGLVVACGVSFASRINFIFFVGLLIAFFLTLIFGHKEISVQALLEHHWTYLVFSIPIVYSSMGFILIIPSLCTYLNRDPKKILWMIIWGTLLILMTYLLWEWLMFGSAGHGPIWKTFEKYLKDVHSYPWIKEFTPILHSINFMIFFAIATSLIGTGIALLDFFSDLFNLSLERRKGWNRFGISALIFIPPLPFAFFLEDFFAFISKYFVTLIGETLIHGILPILLVIQLRYVHKLPAPRFLPGGRIMLTVLSIIIVFLIYLEGIELIR